MPRKKRDYQPAGTRQVVPCPTGHPWDTEPWLKWPAETARAHAYFEAYRDLPSPRRTIPAAWHYMRTGEMGPSSGTPPVTWYEYAERYQWTWRVDEFDRHEERKRIEAMRQGQLDQWKQMGDRHAQEAVALQMKALERLRSLRPEDIPVSEVRQFLIQAATLERLARGASLEDMAQAQREKQTDAPATAIIQYVDDWRGDTARQQRLRSEGSRYGNGQGVLALDSQQKAEERNAPDPFPLPLVRPDGKPIPEEERQWWGERLAPERSADLPVPEAPPRPDTRPPE